MDKPTIIFLSDLNLWSMKANSGAPSFFKTVQGYEKAGWNVYFVGTQNADEVANCGLDIVYKQIRSPFANVQHIRKIGYVFRFIRSHALTQLFCQAAQPIIEQCKREKTIIYAYEVRGVAAAAKLSRRYHIPFVTRFQGTILIDKPYTMMNRVRFYPHYQALAQKSDMVIMTNDGTKGDEVLNRAGNTSERIYFWRNGVDVPSDCDAPVDLDDRILPGDRILLTVSRLVSWKRVDRAIDAFAKIAPQYLNSKLVIIGDGDSRESLEAKARELGLCERVIFLGALPHDVIYAYMKRADIFLSLYDLSNVGNPLMEAMICGRPIITLDNGDTASLIQHEVNGILLSPEDLDKIPYYIERLLDNPAFADVLKKCAKAYAMKHFWNWNERINEELGVVTRLLTGKINSK
ncbi:GDP-mannose-dependent alpha-(1-6)-phosphatidylinositol monomannoside mannosyltransferase [uncultured Clostridium sp.]|nr:GDP-mannose-dependent alpha-(1-6)-phosphatidylinositol monomannoside mannosyltransferase [uncultured Clostridium sp.]